MVALELEAGLPRPLGERGRVPAHDARAVARPQAADCGGRTSLGANPPNLSSPRRSPQPGSGRGQVPRGVGWQECCGAHREEPIRDPDAGGTHSEMPMPLDGSTRSRGPPAGPPHLRRCWRACICLASPDPAPAGGTPPPRHCRQEPAKWESGKPGPTFPTRGRRRRKSGPWSHHGVTGHHALWSCLPLC